MWIKSFLAKYQKITPPEEYVKTRVSQAIEEVTGITVNKKNIILKNTLILIKERYVVKSEIFIKRGYILKHINDGLKDRQFFDIK